MATSLFIYLLICFVCFFLYKLLRNFKLIRITLLMNMDITFLFYTGTILYNLMCIQSAMDILSSILRRNQNNADMSLCQIYLLKLHENILTYERLDLFKEVAIGSNYSLHTTSESPASLLVQISKCYCYPCLQFIFGVVRNFFGPLQNRLSHIIFKENMQIDIKGDKIARIF